VLTLEQARALYPEVVDQIRNEARAEALANAQTIAPVDLAKVKAEAASAELARILGIASHPEAQGRWTLALKLAAIPGVSVQDAAGLLAGVPREQAGGGSEFDKMMAKRRLENPAVEEDDEDDEKAFLSRMRKLDEAALAERAVVAKARGKSGTSEGR
jgi:hypothetical protein